MERIDIKVTFKCNNCCKFCVQGDKRDFCPDKTGSQIKSILRASKGRYKEVVFTGGEPSIRPDIIELINYAKKLGYLIQIQSNGRLFFYKDFCRDMITAGVDIFAVSIHGHNPALHDFLTGAEGSFKQATGGIANLLAFGKPVVTNTVITKLNYRFLPDIARFLITLGIPQYQFAFPHILGRALSNKKMIVPRKKDIILYVKKGIEVGLRKKKTVMIEALPYCFLSGYEECVSDRHIPGTRVFDVELTKNFNRWRKEKGKAKGPMCKDCKYFRCCEGPWVEYPRIFGWKEFKPVK